MSHKDHAELTLLLMSILMFFLPPLAWLAEKLNLMCGEIMDVQDRRRREKAKAVSQRKLSVAKRQAHELFDTLWKSGDVTRTEAYEWLAEELNLSAARCHIKRFDVEMCHKVITLMTK